jgi:phosphoribosylaminoimidazole-succinocarboxamide synthase
MPETLDKDVVRRWLNEHCDPYKDAIPPIPDSIRLETARTYISVFEKISAQPFAYPDASADPVARIKNSVQKYLSENP